MEKPVALFVGRFQPFHNGHVKVVEYMNDEVSKVIIGIGSSQESHTWENPFSAAERKKMIQKSLKVFNRYEIVEIPDVNNDRVWVAHVKRLAPKFTVVYANEEREKNLFSLAGFEVRSTPNFNRETYSGTSIRERIADDGRWEDFVPRGTIEVIKEIGGVARIKELGMMI
jgi:nicotinamide-nucleotide adenylyltransferase